MESWSLCIDVVPWQVIVPLHGNNSSSWSPAAAFEWNGGDVISLVDVWFYCFIGVCVWVTHTTLKRTIQGISGSFPDLSKKTDETEFVNFLICNLTLWWRWSFRSLRHYQNSVVFWWACSVCWSQVCGIVRISTLAKIGGYGYYGTIAMFLYTKSICLHGVLWQNAFSLCRSPVIGEVVQTFLMLRCCIKILWTGWWPMLSSHALSFTVKY